MVVRAETLETAGAAEPESAPEPTVSVCSTPRQEPVAAAVDTGEEAQEELAVRPTMS